MVLNCRKQRLHQLEDTPDRQHIDISVEDVFDAWTWVIEDYRAIDGPEDRASISEIDSE